MAKKKQDNCPLRRRRASPYIGCMRRLRESHRRSLEGRNLASPGRADDKEWNEMEQNGTELKVSPLLGTPDEANQGHSQGRLAHRVRVGGGPKRGHTGLISIARLGVNEAKQGQMGPGFTPPPVVPAKAGTSHPRLGAQAPTSESGQIGPRYGGSPLLRYS